MHFDDLVEKITNDTAKITVMGLGYVGLPLAAEFAKAGFKVMGYDPDRTKVESIMSGRSYVDYPSSDVLAHLVSTGQLEATSAGTTALSEADVVIICVPTPLSKTREPDLSMVINAVELVRNFQRPGMLVVLESTSYPGTTREILVPHLRGIKYEIGEDVFVAYSPERIDPGNPTYNLSNTPKVVAGVTSNCSKLVQRLYFKINEQVVPVTSVEVAEMTKILENSFRAVNIGLVNELALMAKKLGVDPFEVIDAAATKPFGFMPFYPGPGLGGHCIPVDPLYLSWKLRAMEGQARFIDLADTINSQMPHHVFSIALEALNKQHKSVSGSKILVMGVAYKANVSDTRESPVLILMERLMMWGAKVAYEDPYVPTLTYPTQLNGVRNPDYADYDLVLITTAHSAFKLDRVLADAKLIVDTRGVLRDQYRKPLKDPKVYRI